MRIIKLTGINSSPAIATVHRNHKSDNMYFNIKHGSQGENLWVYSCELNKSHFAPSALADELKLDNDNYVIIPVKKNGSVVKDKKDNTLYMITIDHNQNHKQDMLIFWEIPNVNYTEVTYKITGMANDIGHGWSGKERGEICFKSPAPVIEIYGNATLEWSGLDRDGNNIKQTITVINGAINIKPIETLLKDAE